MGWPPPQPEKAIVYDQDTHINGTTVLRIGKNANIELLNTTPIGINSPKRRLNWSPETPQGRARKYSIGETASPSLKRRV